MNLNRQKASILMLHGAVMFFGLSGVIGKYVTLPAVTVTWGRTACSCCLLLVFLYIRKQTLRLQQRKDLALLILAGVVLAIHWVTFFQAIQTSSVAIGTIAFSAFPLFLTVLEPLVFRERFQAENLELAAILLFGVLLTIPAFSLLNRTTVGMLWGLGSSLSYAVLSLCNRALAQKYDGMVICFYEQITVTGVLLPVVLFTAARWTHTDFLAILALGSFCTALAFSLFVYGQKYVKAQTAGMISGLETVYGIFFAWLFLQEIPAWRELLGGTIIIIAAMLSSAGLSLRKMICHQTDKK